MPAINNQAEQTAVFQHRRRPNARICCPSPDRRPSAFPRRLAVGQARQTHGVEGAEGV
jgi:hypothetical protein